MNLIERAVQRYHDLCTPERAGESWEMMQALLRSRGQVFGGRLLCTVLRPHFLSAAEYRWIQGESRVLLGAFRRAHDVLMADAKLRAQMDLSPAEEEMIQIDPGFKIASPTGRLDSFFTHGASDSGSDGVLQFVEYNAETPAAIAYEDTLSDLFLGLPLMREFGRQYEVRPLPARWQLLGVLLDMWAEWGGQGKPNIAIVDWDNVPTYSEFVLFRDYFSGLGYNCQISDPRRLEYRQGRLVDGDYRIDLIYKRVLGSELLAQGGLNHPVIQALREHKVCMVNPFQCKLLHKKMSLAILSDEANADLFSAAEQRAVRAHIPWTRKVQERKTIDPHGAAIDLLPWIAEHQQDLVLKPNDEYGGKGVVIGWETSAGEWQAQLRDALNHSYLVQARVQIAHEDFPTMLDDGAIQISDRLVDTDPFVFYGAYVGGCLTRLSTVTLLNVTAGGGSTVPVFVIDDKA